MKTFLILFLIGFAGSARLLAEDRTVFAEQKLSVVLPDGWKKSERNQGTTMIGWESSDQTSSVFFQKMNVNTSASMADLMDQIIEKFDESEAMEFKKVEKYKTGQVNGVGKKFPAIYTKMQAKLMAQPKDFDMQFYLFIFDTGDVQYFIQASSTMPIWDVREKQIMSLIRSLIARQ